MQTCLQVGSDGRIMLPKSIRQEFGIKPGSKVMINTANNAIQITTVENSLKAARLLVKQYCKSGESVVDEFLQSRRQEAAEEEAEALSIKNHQNE